MLEVREELVAALKKYKKVILKDKVPSLRMVDTNQDTLLHFDVVDAKPFTRACSEDAQESAKSSVDVLCDIFTTTSIPDSGDVLEPVSVLKNG